MTIPRKSYKRLDEFITKTVNTLSTNLFELSSTKYIFNQFNSFSNSYEH